MSSLHMFVQVHPRIVKGTPSQFQLGRSCLHFVCVCDRFCDSNFRPINLTIGSTLTYDPHSSVHVHAQANTSFYIYTRYIHTPVTCTPVTCIPQLYDWGYHRDDYYRLLPVLGRYAQARSGNHTAVRSTGSAPRWGKALSTCCSVP